jgi:hypothetical protein
MKDAQNGVLLVCMISSSRLRIAKLVHLNADGSEKQIDISGHTERGTAPAEPPSISATLPQEFQDGIGFVFFCRGDDCLAGFSFALR